MANTKVLVEYDPKNMIFRNLGSSGLRVPVFCLGAWLTLGQTVQGDPVKEIIKTAFEHGINMIDTAEGYAAGKSETEIGRCFKELGYRRTDWIVTTKIFFGVGRKGPNDVGLSRKHLIEGLTESLERLQMSYVDVVFAHRPDSSVPMAEIVRAFNYLIDKGLAFYWGTSEWSARQIEEAFHVAADLKLISPISEQCKYNAFARDRFEVEYKGLFKDYNYGTTIFSALASGLLTGKYNDGVPEGSRFHTHPEIFKSTVDSLTEEEGLQKINKVKQLTEIAEKELGCSVGALALAWVAKHPNASTIILGATKPQQLLDNLKALDVLPKMTDEIYEKINDILANTPKPDQLWFGNR